MKLTSRSDFHLKFLHHHNPPSTNHWVCRIHLGIFLYRSAKNSTWLDWVDLSLSNFVPLQWCCSLSNGFNWVSESLTETETFNDEIEIVHSTSQLSTFNGELNCPLDVTTVLTFFNFSLSLVVLRQWVARWQKDNTLLLSFYEIEMCIYIVYP